MIEQLKALVKAGYSGIWIQTHELEYAATQIFEAFPKEQYYGAEWDKGRGYRARDEGFPGESNSKDAVYPLDHFQPDDRGLLLLHNYHRFLDTASGVQSLRNAVITGKGTRRTYIVLSPVITIPVELEKLFVVVDYPLPNLKELESLVEGIETDNKEVAPGALEEAKGLTRLEAENAFSLSMVKNKGKICPEAIREQKSQIVKKKGYLELYQGKENFQSLGGLSSLKIFTQRLLKPSSLSSKGLLLVGVSGTGKSAFVKALGGEVGRPVLSLDMGRLHSKYVGESEGNLRQTLQIAEAMSPCILFIDEVEKGLAGVGSDGDSGVSARLFGSLLTWMADRSADVFLGLSANDVTRLPPEFSRAERVDGVFFTDLPTRSERDGIWNIYGRTYEIQAEEVIPNDEGWTGAEIKSCCRLSRLLQVPLTEAAKYVIPVSLSAEDKVDALRKWAEKKVLSASVEGVYQRPKPLSAIEMKVVRKISV